mgnify:CR=1 FL=1
MTTMVEWTITPKTLTEEGNNMKEIFLRTMQEKEGIITKEQLDEMNKYCFVIAEKSFFGKIWDKILWKNDPKDVNMVVVKVIS